ncbi:PKD domain-containing protein [Ideonella sp. A 288]|uniref:PKD domain-containing protein n=1 Tax=Ideonella sp. A 288 TaxID=1962181 RepID=UPI000B4BF9FD|nr:PKD domain-containing protein [Ideonella sp. A 288]
MNMQTPWQRLVRLVLAVTGLVAAGGAMALPAYSTTTDAYCRSIGRPVTVATACADCHLSNRATRMDPQWTWYQAAPKGASAQMANFCPVATANQAPNGTISLPAANVTVTAGQSVAFNATGTDPDNNTPLTYAWNFGGGAANSTLQNPSVVFATAGTFTVSLTVTDARGLADPTPATRTITVSPGSTGNQAPNGTINLPAANVATTVGQSVAFNATGTDPDNNTPLTYAWNFGGGAANSALQNPTVVFNTAGTFTVSLTVTDARGLADPTPATRQVTVVASGNKPPTASITAPAADLTVAKGTTVAFAGTGSDPDGNTPLTYRWNFGGGGMPDSTLQNPRVAFNSVGTFSVTLTVTDRLGAVVVDAPVRIVTVREPLPVGCRDNDGDGFSPEGGRCGPADCNDNNAAINPGAIERCSDGIDNDCNGKTDAADPACNGKDCVGALQPRAPVNITRARWDSGDRELTVEGQGAPVGTAADLFDAVTGALLSSTTVRSNGAWEFEVERLATAPCRVRVEIAGQRGEMAVSGAPATCGGGTGGVNAAPDGRILTPANGVRVRRGRSVAFSATGTDPDGNLPLTYLWDFGSGVTSTLRNPTMVFRTKGSVVVRLTVRDAKGLADPTPAQITIQVTESDD